MPQDPKEWGLRLGKLTRETERFSTPGCVRTKSECAKALRNLGKRLGIHFQESNTLEKREANEAFQNAPSVGQVPTRVITIFPSTTLTMHRTRMQALMPYRPLRILRASSARLPSRSRTMLSPSLSCATRSPRRFTVIFSARRSKELNAKSRARRSAFVHGFAFICLILRHTATSARSFSLAIP